MELGRLGVWKATVQIYVKQSEKLVGHRQKVYADTLTRHVSKLVNQPIEHVCRFGQIWEP